MKRRTALVSLLLTLPSLAAAPQAVPVFPDLDPALKSVEKPDHRGTPDVPNDFIRDIAYPTLEPHLPAQATSPTPAIVICPGGAYAGVAIDKEGRATADFLASHGIAGLVLKYRMPKPDVTRDGDPLPLLDAREALRLASAHAKDWNINPEKIGIMGFSAGGHLASTLITRGPRNNDQEQVRPRFGVLVYPVVTLRDPAGHKGSRTNLLGKSPTTQAIDLYSNDEQVTDQAPPTFLVHAADDHVSPENSILFFQALRAHHVPAELHLFSTGGHGFGLGPPDSEVAQWPTLLLSWLRTQKILP